MGGWVGGWVGGRKDGPVTSMKNGKPVLLVNTWISMTRMTRMCRPLLVEEIIVEELAVTIDIVHAEGVEDEDDHEEGVNDHDLFEDVDGEVLVMEAAAYDNDDAGCGNCTSAHLLSKGPNHAAMAQRANRGFKPPAAARRISPDPGYVQSKGRQRRRG